jgi:hypothetical protein
MVEKKKAKQKPKPSPKKTTEQNDAAKKPEALNATELQVIRQMLRKTPTSNEHEADIRKAIVAKLERMIAHES